MKIQTSSILFLCPNIFNAVKEVFASEFKSFYRSVQGNEGDKCKYNTRLDTYGCGCQHNCDYCYARSLLNFRGFWDAANPRVADIKKVKRKINHLQPCELKHRVTYQTILEMNRCRIGYLIVTKSALIAGSEYMDILD